MSGRNSTLTRSLKDALFEQIEYFFKYHFLIFQSYARKEIFLNKFNRVRIDILPMKQFFNSLLNIKMGRYITEQGLKQLDNYKYKAGKYTALENALQAYWNYMVSLLPMWVAPNLVTFIGWLIFLSSSLAFFYYSFSFQGTIPSWCFFYAAISLFTYQTLDAIDGKQARRTNSSSVLGQLFDHGCDAFSTSFAILCPGYAVQLEDHHIYILYFSSYTALWLCTWKQYHTGIFQPGVGDFGVTQTHFLIIFILVIAGIFGQDVWKFYLKDILPASVLAIENVFLQEIFKMSAGGLICYFFAFLIASLTAFELTRVLINTRTFSSLKETFSLFVIIGFTCTWMKFGFFSKNVGIILFSFGLLIALIACKMIICCVTRMELEFFYKEVIPLIVATAIMWVLEALNLQKGQIYVFWTFFVTVIVMSFIFLSGVIEQIANHLHIYCFSLQKRPVEDKKEN